MAFGYRQKKRTWSGDYGSSKRVRTMSARPMARRRRRRNYRRRTYRNRRYNNKVRMNIVPQRVFTRARYVDQLALTNAIGPYFVHYQYQSSYYDPDLTGTGHQPYLRDQWATFYSYYRVWGIRYRIRLVNRGTEPARLCLAHLGTTNSANTDMVVNWERPYCKRKGVLGVGDETGLTFAGYMSVPRTEGISKTAFIGESSYECGIGTNPSKMAKLSILADSTAALNVLAYVTLDLVTELWGRLDSSKS